MPSDARHSDKPVASDKESTISKPWRVVAIGASAGGLEACKKLLSGLPANSGLACLLVQHLDPHQENLLVDLLAPKTILTVVEGRHGMVVERDHLYVIPPGNFMAMEGGKLSITEPAKATGVRMPIDYLLQSVARECGTLAAAIVLSGTGTDGTVGAVAIRKAGGTVWVQKPADADFSGMPDSVIASGEFDQMLPAAEIFPALTKATMPTVPVATEPLAAIIEHLRTTTAHNYTAYKPGTIQRRVAQNMAGLGMAEYDMAAYLRRLQDDPEATKRLANDILIHVTGFFRDPDIFKALASKVIPDLLDHCAPDHTVRIWVAGCSTGEEAYSLAILFLEEMSRRKHACRLQIFASDADADAISQARAGFYPETIASDVSQPRRKRFFIHDEQGYRVTSELRDCVIFSVHDLLSDPPFSHIDLVSCRNVLIYLGAEAQAKLIAIFHFALVERGLLFLGSAETVGTTSRQFEAVSKEHHIWRRAQTRRSAVAGFELKQPASVKSSQVAKVPTAVASLCQRLIIDHFAPAAVLVDGNFQTLYSMGPIDHYLKLPVGYPSHDVMAMIELHMRGDIQNAIRDVEKNGKKRRIDCGQPRNDDKSIIYDILVLPAQRGGEPLSLVCFVDRSEIAKPAIGAISPTSELQIQALERELLAAKTELQATVTRLEQASEEHRIVNEEALSFNEEYQSTNEELLSSKEELQSLNEELTALNTQLQETLERQRTTSDDLQNVLYSTDVATIFLDTKLNIRFFTPATRTVFNILATDIGRPLSDLNSSAPDENLIDDAQGVLGDGKPRENEIRTRTGTWYVRRISPYLAMEKDLEGVVITFSDITERKHISEALEEAKKQAQTANAAKSRFLAAASHDLRQPLQTLTLLQGLLAQIVVDDKGAALVSRFGDTLSSMAGMLNTLLDINQIEAGTIKAEYTAFNVGPMLEMLRQEFDLQAKALGLKLILVNSSLIVTSDRGLLEQMIRNLLSNALKYTRSGRVLFGCRRRGHAVSIEVWDTGIGIPEHELLSIFEEFHQVDNGARERSRGLGLGLSIVKRLSDLLGHAIELRSRTSKGSAFGILINVDDAQPKKLSERPERRFIPLAAAETRSDRPVMVIEDDPQVRELLVQILSNAGIAVATAEDGASAIAMVQAEGLLPSLIIADYNLPNGQSGLQASQQIRSLIGSKIPVMILTGDISTATLKEISAVDCMLFNKPVNVVDLLGAIAKAVATPIVHVATANPVPDALPETDADSPVVHIVDDDPDVRNAIRAVLEDAGHPVIDHATCEEFLARYVPGRKACILVDAYLPGMSGLDLIASLKTSGDLTPTVMITAHSDVGLAVRAMKAGATDFIEKPVTRAELLATVDSALAHASDQSVRINKKDDATRRVAGLTSRQHEIMDMVLAGHPNKNIASDLGISQRTVENHRAAIMRRTGAKSLPALARLALAAED